MYKIIKNQDTFGEAFSQEPEIGPCFACLLLPWESAELDDGAVEARTSAVTLGWVFLVPTKEAGGEEIGSVAAAGGLATAHDA